MRLLHAAVFGVVLGCAGPPQGVGGVGGARSSAPPLTDRDPVPYVPAPRADGLAGHPAYLIASGGEGAARRMLPSLIAAIQSRDLARVTGLFAEQLSTGSNRLRPRATVVSRIGVYARQLRYLNDLALEDLVDLGRVRVVRPEQHFRRAGVPGWVRRRDLVVTAPLQERGRVPLRALFGWRTRALLVVRVEASPAIIGY